MKKSILILLAVSFIMACNSPLTEDDKQVTDSKYLGTWYRDVGEYTEIYLISQTSFELLIKDKHPGLSTEELKEQLKDRYRASTDTTVTQLTMEGACSFTDNDFTITPSHVQLAGGYTKLSAEQIEIWQDKGTWSVNTDSLTLTIPQSAPKIYQRDNSEY